MRQTVKNSGEQRAGSNQRKNGSPIDETSHVQIMAVAAAWVQTGFLFLKDTVRTLGLY
jgi:hypothetical protein